MISFIKRKKKLCKPGPMLNHELTVINHIFWKDESNLPAARPEYCQIKSQNHLNQTLSDKV